MRILVAGLLAIGMMASALSACANMEQPVPKPEWTLLIHGGAGVMGRAEMTPEMDAKREPWDYDNKYLVTLCEKCHEAGHQQYQIPSFNS